MPLAQTHKYPVSLGAAVALGHNEAMIAAQMVGREVEELIKEKWIDLRP